MKRTKDEYKLLQREHFLPAKVDLHSIKKVKIIQDI